MTIEQIPADSNIEMTEEWHRAFNAAGCNPCCHCCKSMISPGIKFKLGTVLSFNNGQIDTTQSREVMLCETCTPEMFNEQLRKREIDISTQLVKEAKWREERSGNGCFRINGKIVH